MLYSQRCTNVVHTYRCNDPAVGRCHVLCCWQMSTGRGRQQMSRASEPWVGSNHASWSQSPKPAEVYLASSLPPSCLSCDSECGIQSSSESFVEQPKFGHNLVREWRSRAVDTFTRERPKFGRKSQSSTWAKRGLGAILWAIDESMGTNLQTFYKHFYIGCLKTQKQQLHFVNKK